MPISGRRSPPAGIRPVRWVLIALPMVLIPACVLFNVQSRRQTEPPQLLKDPDLEEAVRSESAPGAWRLDAEPDTPGLRTGPMRIRRTRGLGITQQASDTDPEEINAWTQRIDDPPVGEWYRFYLEFGLEGVSAGGVRILLRFYDTAGELIDSNSWSPGIEGTVPIYWGETVGQIPAECTRIEVAAGLNRSASGTFVLHEARLELHDPVIQAILSGESRFINGKLHLVLRPSSQNRIAFTVDLETGAWHPPYSTVASFSRYTLRGRSLDLKLDQNYRYRDESGYELIGTQTWWVRGDFDEWNPGSVGGSFYGTFITMSNMPITRYSDLEGSVTGYLTLEGARVDSLRTRPLHQGRRPPPGGSPF